MSATGFAVTAVQ